MPDDCWEQIREWAGDFDREIERRPEGAKALKILKRTIKGYLIKLMEAGTPDELKQSLNLVVKHIGLTWNKRSYFQNKRNTKLMIDKSGTIIYCPR